MTSHAGSTSVRHDEGETMTIDAPATDTPIQPVIIDLYRDIHKGIRAELFAVTLEAGHTDPADRDGRHVVSGHWQRVADMLVSHAAHEDDHTQPALEQHLPDFAARVAKDHLVLEARIEWLRELSSEAVEVDESTARLRTHQLYLELASFTSAYLDHQDFEERVVMPALEAAVGVEGTGAIHGATIASIPPDEMASALAVMLPAMNVDDRTELLGGMQAGAPPEVFAGVWALAGTVLAPSEYAALGARLGPDV